ncbi:MAG: Restriction modification system DNA specificity domain containing protein [candidate division CPR1 bacterium GW2011_GWA2_42_17]|uniref:Restriction modification system DNA specificity domain containing protein n=1 Tax=candidate division CPR1 bacterium GW2011_GWA2_42_17 TaxID=1618341 RepID=A0A0G1BCF7_9BACT|nr:MAG: Restriction modification system DNA specificity domain containing protein [candidate division CPR1 bacterium GW2011_GWA2_42_17]
MEKLFTMKTETKTTWQKVKFKDFADTSQSVKLERGKEYPFIPMDVVDGQYKFPLEVKHKRFSGGGAKFANGDTIFARITPCLENGKIAMVKGLEEGIGFGSTEFFVFRGKDGVSDSDFVYYLSRTDTIRDPAVKSMVGASGRQRADKTVVDNVQIVAPDLPQQKQIADILSTYDDLIENNTKRIKILEQITQTIYREWFVYFRFPGHEKVKMVDSKTEFGKIPEGWKIGKLSDLAKVIMGQSPSSDFYNEVGEGLPFHQGVTNFGFRFPTTFIYSTAGTRKASTNDILFSVRAPVGRINVANRNIIIGRGLAAIQSVSGHQSHLLYDLKHIFQTEDLIGGGAIFASVTKDDLNNFPVVVPELEIIERFESVVRQIDQLILNTSRELSISRSSRDLLLPKLVTGEISV